MNEYYFLDAANQQKGPVAPDLLKQLGVTSDTLVWRQGLENWTPAEQLPELAPYLMPSAQQAQQQYSNGYHTYPNQGQPYQQGNYNNNYQPILIPPSSNLVWAILTTLLCCLPLGIVSIVYASQVDSEWARGNYDNAYRKSRLARNWAIASAAISIVSGIIYFLCILFGAINTGFDSFRL